MMHDSLDVIGGATGLTRKTLLDIWTDVRANSAALDSCVGAHELQPIDRGKKFGLRYKCSKCGGTVDASAYYWYTKGLTHGN